MLLISYLGRGGGGGSKDQLKAKMGFYRVFTGLLYRFHGAIGALKGFFGGQGLGQGSGYL